MWNAIHKNRRRDQEKRDKCLADSYSVHLARELWRHTSSDRVFLRIRLSEAFDRDFKLETCTKSDYLNREYPLLAQIVIDGYFCVKGKEIAKTSQERRVIHDRCIAHVYSLLLKYETVAVNDAVLQILDASDDFDADKIWKQFRSIVIPHDQLLHADSMLMSRAANVCVPFTWFGRCDFAGQGRRFCSGRHICIIPECRNKHDHSTPFCPSLSTSASNPCLGACIQRVQRDINWATGRGPEPAERRRYNSKKRNNNKKRNNHKKRSILHIPQDPTKARKLLQDRLNEMQNQ